MTVGGAEAAALRPLMGRGWALGLYGVLTVVVLAPVFAVTVPGLGDYLNHLARIDIMARIGGSLVLRPFPVLRQFPVPRQFYESGWRFVPYYGMDLPVLLLSRVLGIYRAGQVFVALCVMMPVAALAVLRQSTYGRVGLVPVLGFAFGYNLVLAYGFLNYLFSAGLAVMLFAGWIGAARRWRRWPRALAFSVPVVGLYLCHAMAAAAYCLMVAGFEVAVAARRRFRRPGEIGLDWLAAACQVLPLIAICALTAGQTQLGVVQTTQYASAAGRLAAALSPFFFPGGGTLAALAILLAAGGLVAMARLRIAVEVFGAACVVGAAALCMPRILLNVWGSDLRLPLVTLILLLAGVSRGKRFGAGTARTVLACGIILAVAKSGQAYTVLSAVDGQVVQMRRLVASIPEGSRVLVAEMDVPGAPDRVVPIPFTGHLALVAAIDRDCFIPFLFTGASALSLNSAMAASGSPNGGPVDIGGLWDGVGRHDPASGPPSSRLGGRIYWWGWPAKFDYVLVENFGAAIPALPDILVPVAHEAIAALYRIDAAHDKGLSGLPAARRE